MTDLERTQWEASQPYGMHLPIFCTFYDAPTEDRLERVIERYVDRADSAFIAGLATEVQYTAWYVALDAWSKRVRLSA